MKFLSAFFLCIFFACAGQPTSTPKKFEEKSNPTQPVELLPPMDAKIKLAWSGSVGASGYKVRTVLGGSDLFDTGNNLAFTIPPIVPDQIYCWSVIAYKLIPGGETPYVESSPSNLACFVLPVVHISSDGTAVTLSYLSTVSNQNLKYALQLSDNLTSGVWFEDIEATYTQTELGNGLIQNVAVENILPGINRFYRISITPVDVSPDRVALDYRGDPLIASLEKI